MFASEVCFITALCLACYLGISHASESIIFPKQKYDFDTRRTIHEDETHYFNSVIQLGYRSMLTNDGTFIVTAENDAEILFSLFVNCENAQTYFYGKGDLKVDLTAALTNKWDSLFLVEADGHVSFNVHYSEISSSNGGAFMVSSSKSVNFCSPRDLVNNGKYNISSLGVGKYSYGQILNLSEMVFSAASAISILTFEDLFNDDKFSCHFDGTTEAAVLANGSIDNEGVIKFYGRKGQSEIRLTEVIFNNGAICLQHSYLCQSEDIRGEGCWVLQRRSFVEIDWRYTFSSTQTIVLSDPSAYVRIHRMRHDETLMLYGVRKGSLFLRTESILTGLSYDTSTGYLSVTQEGGDTAYFGIGSGYDENGFSMCEIGIKYDGPTPPQDKIPPICSCERSRRDSIKFLGYGETAVTLKSVKESWEPEALLRRWDDAPSQGL